MSVIIRLQNLPWSANALDIRQFFHGLSIPEGGVHIVGGELGDAFIAFSTDEDARQAYLRNNGRIKEVQISLMLSSRTEMQKVIEAARAQSYAAFMQAAPSLNPAPAAVPLPAVVPPVVPATPPEVKREVKRDDRVDRKDRRRSRSKSRDRRDRSRDRDRKDRRYRDRSRSRSRDRKSRNRRGRSRSKGRSHSKERDRRSRDRRKRSEERSNPPFQKDKKPSTDGWANANKNQDNNKTPNINTGPSPIIILDSPKKTQGGPQEQNNGFVPGNLQNDNSNSSENWPSKKGNNFGNGRFSDGYPQNEQPFPNRFRNNFGGRYRGDINPKQGCVAVEPFYGGYSDIRRFFNGLFISNRGIKFINDENGRKTGLVLVQFGGSTDRCIEQALSLNGQNLNGINVSVTLIDEGEFEAAVDRYVPSGNNAATYEIPKFKSRNISKHFKGNSNPEPEVIEQFTCLVVDELPNYCKEQDILHMFSQHPLVALILTSKQKGGHIAYVKFSSQEVAKKALEEKSQHFVSGKAVVVKPCKDDEFEEINKVHEVEIDISKDRNKEEELKTDCVSISQLPLKIIDKDIADLFSDIGVIPTKIHLMSNNLGFTGQAYCEFMSTADCTKAVKKNGMVLGTDAIKVVPIERKEMLAVLGQTTPAPEPLVPQEAIIKPVLSPNPMHPMGPFNPRMQHPNRPPFFNRFDGPARGSMRFGPRGGGGPPRPRFPQPLDNDDAPPGCTVYLNNVPYKAGTGEILDLFQGFNHTHNVSRRYNVNNKPSDEAKITFYDPDEASRAVHELNKAKIWDRIIFLRQE